MLITVATAFKQPLEAQGVIFCFLFAIAGHLGFLCKYAQSAPCPKSNFGIPPVPPGNYVLAATAIWTASVASAEGLQLLKSLKLYILHGQLLQSDAPLAGGLWNAL